MLRIERPEHPRFFTLLSMVPRARRVPSSGNHVLRDQNLPSNSSTTNMTRITPKPPVGPYPQFRLYGHVGRAPIKARMSNTTKTVSSIMSFLDHLQSFKRAKMDRGDVSYYGSMAFFILAPSRQIGSTLQVAWNDPSFVHLAHHLSRCSRGVCERCCQFRARQLNWAP
jgi:hypothetical protein